MYEKRYLYFQLQNSILFDFSTIDYFTNNIENVEYFFSNKASYFEEYRFRNNPPTTT